MPGERKMNPPINGHELLYEGRNWIGPNGWPSGGCRCGEQPARCGYLGVNAVKRWHREHKVELRAAGPSVEETNP